MNRRRFIQTTLGFLVIPLVVPENPYRQLGFTNITDMRRNGEHLFYDVFVHLNRGNVQDGWLSINKYKDTYIPPDWKKKFWG